MAEVCRACAMRVYRSASTSASTRFAFTGVQRRTFTATTSHQKQVGPPVFTQTSSQELDDALLALRNLHFVPAYMNKRQRQLIFGDKYREELENNPAYATLGGQEVRLKHIDRRVDIPARSGLVLKIVNLMRDDDWRQLPNLLEGLYRGSPLSLNDPLIQKVIRRALEADQLPSIITSLKRCDATGLSLKDRQLLSQTIWSLRKWPQTAAWEQARLQKAMAYSAEIAQLLESDEHGTGRKLLLDDPRTRPEVIGVFLELHAVHALKYQDARDTDGKVKAYAERLMACLNESSAPPTTSTPERGPHFEFRAKFPIWHGLKLASSVLNTDLPQASKAQAVIADYGARLSQLVDENRSTAEKKPNSYHAETVDAWDAAITRA